MVSENTPAALLPLRGMQGPWESRAQLKEGAQHMALGLQLSPWEGSHAVLSMVAQCQDALRFSGRIGPRER